MSEGLKKQLNIYTKFVKNLIVQNDVLDKSFFIVVCLTILEQLFQLQR